MKCLHNIALLAALNLGILFASNMAAATPIDELEFLTENYAPFNYEKDGKAQGITVDLLLEMFKKEGSSKTREDITVLPWSRGYRMAQDKKNVVLFVTVRTEPREHMFKWVGPIMPAITGRIAKSPGTSRSAHLRTPKGTRSAPFGKTPESSCFWTRA